MERDSTLNRISPRSALRVAAAMNTVLFLVWMVAALVVFIGLGISGVWGRMNSLLADLTGSDTVGAGTYFGVAAGVGVLEAVVVTVLAPVVAVLYNSVATLVGGLRVTVGDAPADAVVDVTADVDGAVGDRSVTDAAPAAGDAVRDAAVDAAGATAGDAGQAGSDGPAVAVVSDPTPADRLAGWGLENRR